MKLKLMIGVVAAVDSYWQTVAVVVGYIAHLGFVAVVVVVAVVAGIDMIGLYLDSKWQIVYLYY